MTLKVKNKKANKMFLVNRGVFPWLQLLKIIILVSNYGWGEDSILNLEMVFVMLFLFINS